MFKTAPGLVTAALFSFTLGAHSAELSLASSNIGNGLELLREQLDRFETQTGHVVTLVPMPDSSSEQFTQYKVWLSAESSDVDVLLTDIIWAPQLAEHFEDLSAVIAGREQEFLPATLQSQLVDGRLVALPLFTSAPALFYRKDLLAKYDIAVPQTWTDLTVAAQQIMEAERLNGHKDFWGYVFQGSPYEGLTCNMLEWVRSNGGGSVIDATGSIDIDIELAAESLNLARSWVGTISPEGVLSYQEEESRGVWQLGNAAFMRNWPYAETLGNFDDSPIKGKFAIAPLPHSEDNQSTPTLGGWNVAVSKYATDTNTAKELAEFLISRDNQIERLRFSGDLPTLIDIYSMPEIVAEQPSITQWLPILEAATPRPSAVMTTNYNEASAAMWTTAHAVLSGTGNAADELRSLVDELMLLKP